MDALESSVAADAEETCAAQARKSPVVKARKRR
jgi:hypothetical protein